MELTSSIMLNQQMKFEKMTREQILWIHNEVVGSVNKRVAP